MWDFFWGGGVLQSLKFPSNTTNLTLHSHLHKKAANLRLKQMLPQAILLPQKWRGKNAPTFQWIMHLNTSDSCLRALSWQWLRLAGCHSNLGKLWPWWCLVELENADEQRCSFQWLLWATIQWKATFDLYHGISSNSCYFFSTSVCSVLQEY